MLQPFHLAIPVHNLGAAQKFYGDVLGCTKGRASKHWIDWNFWGHQLVTHLDESYTTKEAINLVDGKDIGVPHFGVVLEWQDWEALKTNIDNSEVEYVLEPYIRFKGEKGHIFCQRFLRK